MKCYWIQLSCVITKSEKIDAKKSKYGDLIKQIQSVISCQKFREDLS